MTSFPTCLRRRRAHAVIVTYCEFSDFNISPDEALIDLLTDLRHWSHEVGIDFGQALEHAGFHFEAEVPS